MKNKKLLWFIGAGVLVIVIAAVVICILMGGKRKSDPQEDPLYGGIEEIVYVKYKYSEKEYELVKKGDTWRWKDDKSLEIDQKAVQYAVQAYETFPVIDFFEEVDDLAAYGLEKETYRVMLKDRDGDKKTILIGNCAGDDGTAWYAMEKGDDVVYVVSYEIVEFLDNLEVQRNQAVEKQELYGENPNE